MAVCCSILNACASFRADTVMADGYASEVRQQAGGLLEFRGSTLDRSGPIPYISLWGTPFERGLAYGVLLREDIADIARDGKFMLGRFKRGLPPIIMPFVDLGSGFIVEGIERRIPTSYLEEIRGMAKGAGQPYEAMLMSAYGLDSAMGCTSVLAVNQGRKGILHGRNFDLSLSFLARHPVLVRYKARSEREVDYWNLGSVSVLGSYNGFNVAGVSVSINVGKANRNGEGGMPMMWKVREILGAARTIDDVRRIVSESGNDNVDWILSVGSASESMGIVFDLKDKLQAETIVRPGDPQVVLNRPFGDGRHLDDGLAAKHLDAMEKLQSEPRWKASREFLSRQKLESVQDLWLLLRDRSGAKDFTAFSSMAETIARSSTLFTMVVDLSSGYLTFSSGESWASLREAWRFDLTTEEFDLFLPADPLIYSDEFRRRENAFLALKRADLEGTMTLGSVLDIGAADLDPFVINDAGMGNVVIGSRDPRVQQMLESFRETYRGRSYPTAFYAKHVALTKSEADAIPLFEESLSCPDCSPFLDLYFRNELVDLYQHRKLKGEARAHARVWLERYRQYSEGSVNAGAWLSAIEKKMRRLSGS